MQVIRVDAGFIGLFIACAALIFCILVGIFYAHEMNKKLTQLRKREAAKLNYQREMEKIHIADAKKQAYEHGYEDGYHAAKGNPTKGKGENDEKDHKPIRFA